jgi:hypothetical protein
MELELLLIQELIDNLYMIKDIESVAGNWSVSVSLLLSKEQEEQVEHKEAFALDFILRLS